MDAATMEDEFTIERVIVVDDRPQESDALMCTFLRTDTDNLFDDEIE